MIELLNIDCMDYMATLPDKAFDLAIVDPPYGIDHASKAGKMAGQQYGNAAAKKRNYVGKDWDAAIPDEAYFLELMRVSKNQIVLGGVIILLTYLHQNQVGYFGIKITATIIFRMAS